MADRFPSLDQIDAGNSSTNFAMKGEISKPSRPYILHCKTIRKHLLMRKMSSFIGQTEPQGDASFEVVGESADTSDFLSRERALLGDDADQFATPNDNAATVEDAGDDDEDDLLGGGDDGGGFGQQQQTGGGGGGGSDMAEFESSFPAIDASNEVRCILD